MEYTFEVPEENLIVDKKYPKYEVLPTQKENSKDIDRALY